MEAFTSIKNKRSKKGQTWSLDLVIASIIFLSGIVMLYIYAINYTSQSKGKLDELFYEGNLASELILSGDDFGILTDNSVNQTKLDDFYSNYAQKKALIGVKRDFYFILQNLTIGGNIKDYVGVMNSTNTNSLIQVTRITIYKNKPTRFNLYLWE